MNKTTILIVDDDAGILDLLETALADEGYETRRASTINEAVKIVEEGEFGLAILDIYLPDGTGLDLAAKLKASNPKLPIIIMTGTPDSTNVSISVDIEIDAYLIKPIVLENLFSLVEELT